MSRNRVKHANVVLLKLIYNFLAEESMHFEDVKVEVSLPRLVNVFLMSFKGLTYPYPEIYDRVRGAKND